MPAAALSPPACGIDHQLRVGFLQDQDYHPRRRTLRTHRAFRQALPFREICIQAPLEQPASEQRCQSRRALFFPVSKHFVLDFAGRRLLRSRRRFLGRQEAGVRRAQGGIPAKPNVDCGISATASLFESQNTRLWSHILRGNSSSARGLVG